MSFASGSTRQQLQFSAQHRKLLGVIGKGKMRKTSALATLLAYSISLMGNACLAAETLAVDWKTFNPDSYAKQNNLVPTQPR